MTQITLKPIRQLTTVTLEATLTDNGVKISWPDLENVKAYIYSEDQRIVTGPCTVEVDGEDDTVLICRYGADQPQFLGVQKLVITCDFEGQHNTYDKKAFEFVASTDQTLNDGTTVAEEPVEVDINVKDVSSSILAGAIQAALDAAEFAARTGENVQERADQDHTRAEEDHTRAGQDHTQAGQDHTRAEEDHTRAGQDHTQAEQDHTQAGQDHTRAGQDHTQAEQDHTRAEEDHTRAGQDHTQAGQDHTQAGQDHTRAGEDHTRAENDHTQAGQDHTQANQDHTRAGQDHTQAGQDHTRAGEDHDTVLALTTGLIAIIMEDGLLKFVQNAESGTMQSGTINSDGYMELNFSV